MKTVMQNAIDESSLRDRIVHLDVENLREAWELLADVDDFESTETTDSRGNDMIEAWGTGRFGWRVHLYTGKRESH